MKNKTVLKLLGIFHICLFLLYAGYQISVLSKINYFDDYTKEEASVNLAAEPETVVADTSEIEMETEVEPEPEIETEIVTEPVEEIETEPEEEPVYFNGVEVPFDFQFSGRSRLNIRDTPSMEGAIIGKVPRNVVGTVTGVYDEEWVMVSFEGTEGYCSADWIAKVMDEENQ